VGKRAELVAASLATLALAACGNAASSSGAGAVSVSQTSATAQAGAKAASTPPSPAPSAGDSTPTPVTIQAVGSEIIRYWVQHKGGIGNYSLARNDFITGGAKCVTLYSNQALAETANGDTVQDPAQLNEPSAVAAACATGNFEAGDITVVGLSSSQLSAQPGPNDLLYVDDHLLNGTWDLVARQGTPQAVHHIQLTPAQVAEAVHSAFVFAAAQIPSGD
jgi:hypothetical protein